MNIIIDAPSHMAKYLLQGWTLTSDACPYCSIPMMRPPRSQDLLCVNCNSNEEAADAQLVTETRGERLSISTPSEKNSRGSTPPTDISPPPSPPFALPPPTEETLRRRAQSDRASQEIGTKMLQGWTMLADECPNPTCYGIPLVRAPGTVQKECVICHNVYLPEGSSRKLSTSQHLEQSKTDHKGKKADVLSDNMAPTKQDRMEPEISVASNTLSRLVNQSVSASDTLTNRLHQSLKVLERLLDEANSTSNIKQIGDTAEAIAKVSHAINVITKAC